MARALEVFKSNGKAAIVAAEKARAAEEERVAAEEKQKLEQEERDLAARTAEKERLAAEARQKLEQEERDLAARAQAERERIDMINGLSESLGDVVAAASNGDFSRRIEAQFSDEQLTELGENVNRLIVAVDHGLTETRVAVERVANGDLSKDMSGVFSGDFKNLQDNINTMIASLKLLLSDVSQSSDNLSHSSQELNQTSSDREKCCRTGTDFGRTRANDCSDHAGR